MSNENVKTEEETAISETSKDIKKRMDSYQAKMKSATGEEPPAGDVTRSEE